MSNTRKILIVDDDAELRDALVEQLALHEEFESLAVETGARGVQAGPVRSTSSPWTSGRLMSTAARRCNSAQERLSRRRSSC
jgi:hypothetical protein